MVATPNSVKMFGANPIFVDVEPETLCLDIEIVKAITKKLKQLCWFRPMEDIKKNLTNLLICVTIQELL